MLDILLRRGFLHWMVSGCATHSFQPYSRLNESQIEAVAWSGEKCFICVIYLLAVNVYIIRLLSYALAFTSSQHCRRQANTSKHCPESFNSCEPGADAEVMLKHWERKKRASKSFNKFISQVVHQINRTSQITTIFIHFVTTFLEIIAIQWFV